MLLKNGSVTSATEVEMLARELADVEVHCKDGGLVLWYRPLLAAWSPMLRLAHLHKIIETYMMILEGSQFRVRIQSKTK